VETKSRLGLSSTPLSLISSLLLSNSPTISCKLRLAFYFLGLLVEFDKRWTFASGTSGTKGLVR
jgi:hypothetical protein